MRALTRLERFIERLVERPSARLFRTRLQPVQVLRRIERAMDAGRGAGDARNLVPDRFVVHLHPDDLASLLPGDEYASELASRALTYARSRGYAVRARPRVTLQRDPSVRAGEVEVDAAVSPVVDPVPGDDPVGGTRAFEVPVVQAPAALIEVREPGKPPRHVPVTGSPMRIGRAPECEIVLRDSRASRRHARLHARAGVLVLADLGSTNGTRVNGHRVTEVVLGAGDQIQIGDSSLTVQAVQAGAGSRP